MKVNRTKKERLLNIYKGYKVILKNSELICKVVELGARSTKYKDKNTISNLERKIA